MLNSSFALNRSRLPIIIAFLLLPVAPGLCNGASLLNSDVVGLRLGMSPQQVSAAAAKELPGYSLEEKAVSLGSSKLIYRQVFTQKSADRTDIVAVFYSGDPDHSAITSLV